MTGKIAYLVKMYYDIKKLEEKAEDMESNLTWMLGDLSMEELKEYIEATGRYTSK